MTNPTSVQIGHREYKISFRDRRHMPDNAVGAMNMFHREMLVSNEMNPEEKAATILHETLHAIWRHAGCLPSLEEEQAVIMFENGLLDAMRQNPDLFRWFIDSVTKKDPVPMV